MESSLHRALKDLYGDSGGGRSEVTVEAYRVDAIDALGELIEVQSAALGPLRRKLASLLPMHPVRVVKPVVVRKRIVRRSRRNGPDVSARRSVKHGSSLDVFDDLVGLARTLPHPNLTLEILEVDIDEIRLPKRRWPGFMIADRQLTGILRRTSIERPSDLWSLLPTTSDWSEPFTTLELSQRIGRPLDFARRVAYCLRESGACRVVGKKGNRWIYVESGSIVEPAPMA